MDVDAVVVVVLQGGSPGGSPGSGGGSSRCGGHRRFDQDGLQHQDAHQRTDRRRIQNIMHTNKMTTV